MRAENITAGDTYHDALTDEQMAELDTDLAHTPAPQDVDLAVTSFVYDTSLDSPNYTPSADAPPGINGHHWGQPHLYRDTSARAIAGYLSRTSSQAGVQYVCGPGVVYQIISDTDDSWNSGTARGNKNIAVEMKPIDGLTPASEVEVLVQTAAELTASLWHRWPSLPRQPWTPHNHWVQTSCPGNWEARFPEIFQRAIKLYPLYTGAFGQFHTQGASVAGLTTTPQEDDVICLVSIPDSGQGIITGRGAKPLSHPDAVLAVHKIPGVTHTTMSKQEWDALIRDFPLEQPQKGAAE